MHKILIANRGEIAVRVIRSAREMGFRTVAVYSEADADAPHVTAADQAVCIGAASAAQSYLSIPNLLEAAALTGADAIHPGYGFLSENADFARACENAGIVFIGPPAAAIELMGSKRLSKVAMQDAGVPCVPGYQGEAQDEATLLEKAREVGFPLMIKASAGGGGRGMRLVSEEAALAAQLKTARSEAQNAFGNGELILERAVVEPRHIEIQVFADNHGNVVYLGERDCSIQRRHQKVVEEAPSPFVDEALRQQMGEAAVNAARACDYRGAGTVEFLVDAERQFYFLEMNTRLQVEHPVTELVTGQDLVAWQLAVAAGEPLPLTQEQIPLCGHAIEVRLYAEDPRRQFMPQTGTVLQWQVPAREGLRLDGGICEGQVIGAHYDPMLAKLIAFGDNREMARRRLVSMLRDTALLGVHNNRIFLHNALSHPAFINGDATTAFIDQHLEEDASLRDTPPTLDTLARAALLYHCRAGTPENQWRSAAPNASQCVLECEGQTYVLQLQREGDDFRIQHNDEHYSVRLAALTDQRCTVMADRVRESFPYVFTGEQLCLDDGSGHYRFDNITYRASAVAGAAGDGQVKAPMDGVVVDVLVENGATVTAGQTLLVMEAMKMEHPLKAGIAGVVGALNVAVGQQLKSKQVLATIVANGGEE